MSDVDLRFIPASLARIDLDVIAGSRRAPRRPFTRTSRAVQEAWRFVDAQLGAPLRVERSGDVRTVWVLDSFGYRFDARARTAHVVHRDLFGRVFDHPGRFCLLGPLRSAYIVELVAHRLALWLPHDAPNLERPAFWKQEGGLPAAVWRRMENDPRFLRLRDRELPEALALDPHVVRIGLACRLFPVGASLSNELYGRAWRAIEPLTREATRSPRLLPVLAELTDSPDPGAALRQRFESLGLSGKSFAYARKVGVRWARCLLQQVDREQRVDTYARLVRCLDLVGRPRVPRGELLRRILVEALRCDADLARLRHFLATPAAPRILPLVHAHLRALPANELDAGIAEAGIIADEVEAGTVQVRCNSKWQSLLDRARRAAQAGKAADARCPLPAGVLTWRCGDHVIEPARTLREVAALGSQLRNCLKDDPAAYTGDSECIVAIRNAAGRPVAVMHLDGGPHQWQLTQIAGFAGTRPDRATVALARRYVSRLRLAAAQRRSSKEVAARDVKPAIRLSCAYSGMPGSDWHAFVDFRATASGFSVWAGDVHNPAYPAMKVATSRKLLDWRGAASTLLRLENGTIGGDFRGYVNVEGESDWRAELLALCWMREQDFGEAIPKFLARLPERSLEILSAEQGGFLSDEALEALNEYLQHDSGDPVACWHERFGESATFSLAGLIVRFEQEAQRQRELVEQKLQPFAAAIGALVERIVATWPRPGSCAGGMGHQMRKSALCSGIRSFVLAKGFLPDEEQALARLTG